MIIGRKEEIELLKNAHSSPQAEFVAIYGRRRIGKTYLVKECFEDKFTFSYTGIWDISTQEQIDEFYKALIAQGLSQDSPRPKNWFDAFHLLEVLIANSSDKKKVVFIDELPWMDAPNSRFLSAFEHFWNGWGSGRKDLLLIICGSASSWIINKLFRNKGGLYNRVTCQLKLSQFSLGECEEYVKALNLPLSRDMILEGYMVMGGVPYYWSRLNGKRSIDQNISRLFLKENGTLRNEFHYIYASMFNRPEKYMKVVETLAGKKSGLTREEIVKKSGLDNNGQFSSILEDLIECGFVRKYCHTGKKLRDALYQLVDLYTLFYFQFVKDAYGIDEEFWERSLSSQRHKTWCGLAFEKVCLLHTRQIKRALGISGMMANIFSWHIKKTDTHQGVQIDLLIDRADNVVDVCEMKYAPDGYTITAPALEALKARMSVLRLYMPAKKYIEPVLITSDGIRANIHSAAIRNILSSEDLFLQ